MAKYRTGFVSNSSSTSFICNVCGENVSGMDMGLSEAGMFKCVNEHTCCDSHRIIDIVELTMEEKRKFLIDQLDTGYNIKWYADKPSEKAKEIARYNSINDVDVEDNYSDAIRDAGEPECNCPICQFKNLDTDAGLKYLLKKHSLVEKDVLKELSDKFSSYREFEKYINK